MPTYLDFTKQDVYDFFGVSRIQGYEILNATDTNRPHHRFQVSEHRGRSH